MGRRYRTMSSLIQTAVAVTGTHHTVRLKKAAVSPPTRGVTKLMYACQQGDVDKVRKILRDQPFSLMQRDRKGKSPLHYCSTSDYIGAAQAADLLVMAAPDLVEGHDDEGFTPLHLAVIAGNMPLITFLLANKADINAVDSERHTVVHWATVCGETEALRAVLSAGAPVSTPDIHGGFPLHYAAQMCGGEKDSMLGLQVLHTLLSHPDIVVSVEDGDRRQPLLWAASAGSAKAVLALVRAGAAVEAPDKDGLTALHCAASRGHTDCIDTLLTLCGASPDVIDSNGCTALHYAVTLGHADATALLLAHGANPNRQDRKGRSPAHCGCAKGQLETLKLLGANNANLWLRNARGDLPLHEAAASGRRELVKWLLEARPSQVNARNNDGRCPLHLAALNDNSDLCKILLDSGAQVNPVLRTSKNAFMTPLDCALQRGFRSTAKYLQLHGGLPSNRLSGSHQVGGATSINIREEVSLQESSTDSERENTENHNGDVKKRTLRRKLAYRYENKKGIQVQTSDEITEQKDDKLKHADKHKKGKPATTANDAEVIQYSSEVLIKDKVKNISFEKNKDTTVKAKPKLKQEQTVIDSSGKDLQSSVDKESKKVPAQSEKRPKSAKRTRAEKHKKTPEKEKASPNIVDESIVKTTADKEVKIETATASPVKIEQNGTKDATNLNETVTEVTPISQKLLQPMKASTESMPVEKHRLEDQSALSNTSLEDTEAQTNIVVEAHVHSPPAIQSHVITGTDVSKSDNVTETLEAASGLQGIEEPIEAGQLTKKIATNGEESKQQTEILKDVLQANVDTIDAEREDDVIHLKETDADAISELKKLGEVAEEGTVNVAESITTALSGDLVEFDKAASGQGIDADLIADEAKGEQQVELLPTQAISETKVAEAKTEKQKEESFHLTDVAEMQGTGAESNTTPITPTTTKEPSTSLEAGAKELPKDTNGIELIPSAAVKTEVVEAVPAAPRKENIEKSDDVSKEPQEKSKAASKKKYLKPKATLESKKQEAGSTETRSSSEDTTTLSTSTSKEYRKEHKSFRILDDNEMQEQKATKKAAEKRKTKRSAVKKQRSRSEEISKRTNESDSKDRKSKIPTPMLDLKPRRAKSDKHLDKYERKVASSMETRIPVYKPQYDEKLSGSKDMRSESNMSAPLHPSAYSDDERGSMSDMEDVSSATRKKRLKKRSKVRDSKSAGSDYESSNLIDSGFEPSPRSTRVPKWRNMSDRGVNMTSVTQSIQSNIRKYHLERKIFQHLLELKRLQIRAGQHNEAILVKRAIDAYHRSCAATVGAGRYVPEEYTFKSFERFLYHSLRKLQKDGADYLKGLPEASECANPLLCTQSTNRCMHATHAYTGVPCAAYLPKMDHHTIPKIGFDCKPSGFLPHIHQKKAPGVTLELCHGSDKQVISLPADRLDQNKRYYVTFTVKGHDVGDTPVSEGQSANEGGHRHSKSD